jgi:hypothetical protein
MAKAIMESMGCQCLKPWAPGAPGPSHLGIGVTSHLSAGSLPFGVPTELAVVFPRNQRRNRAAADDINSNQ